MLTNREEYIKKTFFHNLDDEEASEIIKKISEIGNSIGFIGGNANQNQNKADKRKHKYDVWISKEVKKEMSIINRMLDIRLIVDWASETNADIFKMSFDEAYKAQMDWHNEMRIKYQFENLSIPDVDENRIIFRCSDGEHFIYMLNAKELTNEGMIMGHCVGGKNYKSRVKNRLSLIFSVRDKNNMPHVTIEIDVNARRTTQKFGKSNKPPIEKYIKMYVEFGMYASDFPDIDKEEILDFLNIDTLVNRRA